MSDFLRKASLKVKGSSHDLADQAEGRKPFSQKPPKSRSASAANSLRDEPAAGAGVGIGGSPNGDGSPKRKQSLAKKRLSSLFSSSSLSSDANGRERERSGSPSVIARTPQTISPAPSGQSTPTGTGNGNGAHANAKYGQLGKGDERMGLQNLSLGTAIAAAPATGATAVESSPATPPRRPESLYSQWDLEELSDDEDDDVFLTPTEGLSEIGEDDEPVDAPAPAPASVPMPSQKSASVPVPAAASAAAPTTTVPTRSASDAQLLDGAKSSDSPAVVENATLAATSVTKGATAQEGDVCGTGPSTVRRTQPVQSKTRVRPRHATKTGALSFDQEKALGPDVDTTREVLRRFLTSQMKEAEDLCFEKDPDGNHLYLQSAHGYIQALKGMMTFDADDLTNALDICRNIHVTATALRKPSDGLMSRVGGLVRSGAGVQRVKAMSLIERHAELVYAESSLMKAMLAIVAGGDWMGLIREALNMRSAHGTYHTLQQFIDQADKDGYDEDIDMDFRSGVALGTGTSSLMLSLLPGKVLKIAEVFGYAGDRTQALATLMATGGWSSESDKPAHDERDEGLRRPVCDLILLAFHLVISLLMPVAGVDIPMARKILEYNNRRYPDGIFFLYFTARLHTAQCEPEKAIECLQRALDLQLEYVQLQHMCLWDYALDYTMVNNWKGALDCFSILREESNWSRAVYTYSSAACLVELVADGHPGATLQQADVLMKSVKGLTKKLAGKSLPIEKLAVRKTRKFESQGQYLFLPGLELAYVYGALYHTPRSTLLGVHLPRIEKQVAKLKEKGEEAYGVGYWDDYCLGQFLRGVCLAMARYQPPDACEAAKSRKGDDLADDEVDRMAEEAYLDVIRCGPEVQLDHYILYHNHFELGKLYARRGDKANALKQFDHVMNGKLSEPNRHESKNQGKYSLEGALLLKTHSAIQALKEGRAAA